MINPQDPSKRSQTWFAHPVFVPVILVLLSGMTILFAAVQVFQIPLGTLPPESERIATAPYGHFAHVVGGTLFGLLGPVQFGRVLARKYGRLHRILGRVFVLSGAALALSSVSLFWSFPTATTSLLSGARLAFGIALGIALIISVTAIRARNITRHRDWMIRAYAIGIGATLVSNLFLPIFLITGIPPSGLLSDVLFIGSWLACIVFAEFVVRRVQRKGQVAIP